MDAASHWLHIGFANDGAGMYWVWVKLAEGEGLPVYEVTLAGRLPDPDSIGHADQLVMLAEKGLRLGPFLSKEK